MPKPTQGLINARDAKPPRPPASPKGFVWPERKRMRNGMYEKFSASLQELLTEKGANHNDMAKALYGHFDNGVARTIKGRNWIAAKAMPPDETEAAYVAQYLGVPMSRLLEPKGTFNPEPDMLRRRGGKKKKAKRAAASGDVAVKVPRAYKKKAGAPPEDNRWLLPAGVPRPSIKIETSQDYDSMTHVELHADLPPHVAMAIYSMVTEHRAEPKLSLPALT